jgi:phospholipid/cholesterol/gamma-HCH transport system substrate-binding protein
MRRPGLGGLRRGGGRRAVAVAVAASAMLLGGCALSLQSLPKLSSESGGSYPIYGEFANVLNLPQNAQVRVGAQVVGLVGNISTHNFHADLTLEIKHGVRLLAGTTAQVRFDNPLGDEYILLHAPISSPSVGGGSSGLPISPAPVAVRYLTAGSHIPLSDTSTAPSVEDAFGALSLVLNGGGINQLGTIIRELNNTFGGNEPQIRSFLTTIDTAQASLAQGQTPVDNALASIENLTNTLNGGRQTIANGIDSIAPAIGVLASENGDIGNLFTQLSQLGAVGTRIAQEAGLNSVNDAKALLPVAQELASVSQQLGPDLNDLASFEALTPKVAPGDYLQVNVTANVTLPAGGFQATPVSAAATSSQARTLGQASASSSSQAVAQLLGAGLL